MRHRLKLATATALLAASLAAFAGWRAGARPRTDRSVILVTVDTLRADRVGAYGYAAARTPHIDDLAREGTLFLQATTPFPRTTPALASLLTGLWAHHHGSREVGAPMRIHPTLAEALHRRGYATLAVSANGSAGRVQHLDIGFAHFVDREELRTDRAERVTDRALELVRETAASAPILLWVHYVDPHFPYEPPADTSSGTLAMRRPCRALAADMRAHRVKLAYVHNDRDGLASRALPDCLAAYDGEVSYTDSEIGRLLQGLRDLGRVEGALVIFTSDHGENMGEDRIFYEHGPSVHDASLRVPLIVAGGGSAGRVDTGVARLEDVMPTLLSLLGEPRKVWPEMDGVDLSERLDDSWLLRRAAEPLALAEGGADLFVESHHQVRSGQRRGHSCLNNERFSLCEKPGWDWPRLFDRVSDPELRHDVSDVQRREKRRLMQARRLWPAGEARQRTARTTNYKLVEHPRWQGGYDRRLFDLRADPGETRDVSREHPDVAERLTRQLEAWTAQIVPAREGSEPGEELESLRTLGYIQ